MCSRSFIGARIRSSATCPAPASAWPSSSTSCARTTGGWRSTASRAGARPSRFFCRLRGTRRSGVAATLLLVEDDPSILRGLQMNLQLEGYHLFAARDGEEALRIWRQHKPDLIVLDIMLPHRDGYEVLRTIRAEDPDTRVLVLSAK